MIFIGDRTHPELSSELAKALKMRAQFPQIHQFFDGERRVKLSKAVSGQDVVILKSFIAPTIDSSIIELCFVIDAAKHSKAKSVTVITPYFPYQRADRIFETGEGIPLTVVARMLESAGMDRVVILDPHIDTLPNFFSIPVVVCSTVDLFVQQIQLLHSKYKKISLVSPDKGGKERVLELQKHVKQADVVILSKHRDHLTGKVSIRSHKGDISDVCIVVDDMITTGNTIIEATQYLISQGAEKVFVMATHPVFSGDTKILFSQSKIKEIYVTDSIDIPKKNRFKKLEILSIAHVLADITMLK
ncbi:MAG TPA: ribose-phosphate diphosphokinase [Candidatus Levybacteria bacterium]|nr:ribose-phosphate diphosphokinase [Candidatus Levybacteria bacterium]